MDNYDICAKIEKYLSDEGIHADVTPASVDLPVVDVEIHWGDWKHEHGRAKWLVGQLGGVLFGTTVTEEDGSDCYSAFHRFYVGDINEDMLGGGNS